ncbi:MAG: hypothetical protein AAGB34_07505 [Planctomycetota bacterium]
MADAEDTGQSDAKDPLEDSVVDRRMGFDRRKIGETLQKLSGEEDDPNEDTTLDRRRGPGRRRSDFTKSAEEGEMTKEQFLFLLAIDEFKRANQKAFPNWTDVLEVVRLLGYRKTAPSGIPIPQGAEDWKEKPDAPAGVRDITNPSEQ